MLIIFVFAVQLFSLIVKSDCNLRGLKEFYEYILYKQVWDIYISCSLYVIYS